jgi:cytochrome c
MDSFELNKIIGAILGTCILVLVTSFAANAVFTPHNPEKPGFEIAVKEEAGHGGPAGAAAPSEPIEKRVARTGSARTSLAPSMRRRARARVASISPPP